MHRALEEVALLRSIITSMIMMLLLACGAGDAVNAGSATAVNEHTKPADNTATNVASDESVKKGIYIYNATGIDKLAGKVAGLLKEKSLGEAQSDNWKSNKVDKTFVFYAKDAEKTARQIAELLSVEDVRPRRGEEPAVEIGVVLGADFDDWNLIANLALPSGDMSLFNQRSAPTTEVAAPKELDQTEGIYISLSKRVISYYEKGELKGSWQCAVGAADSPTPTGEYKVTSKTVRPDWSWKGKIVPYGPKNGLGERFLGISKPTYGIHGTNDPDSIGKAVSHGCVRLHNLDIIKLYDLVKTGTKVTIVQ